MCFKISDIKITEDEPMSRHTTFRTGGPARYYAEPACAEDITELIAYCGAHGIRYSILGNGSNVLFPDEGYDGMVIRIGSAMGEVRTEGCRIYTGAGAILARVAQLACEAGLAGMEFASGIPGSLGGAIVMNAGAYGGEMKDLVTFADILHTDGNIRRYTAEEMEFSYRHSIVDADKIVIGAELLLTAGDKEAIRKRINELAEARRSKQPLEYASAGSTFKRPEGYFAAKLIDDCGLRGYSVGDAMVSEKHCGFVVNTGHASSADVLAVMRHVQETVQKMCHVKLEPEVRVVR